VISSLSAGLIGILLAYNGWGVWSLVWRSIFSSLAGVLLLWFWSKFRPTLQFSLLTIKEMFGFGSKLLGAWLINTIYNNVYYLIIGKFFSAKELGLYTRAEQFSALPSSNINGIIQKVSYPVLAELSDDKIKLKAAYKKLIKSTMFITFTVMLWMAAVAVPLIEVLLGDRWLESAQYLQLIVFAGMLYPLHSLNLNMLKVEGRSDLFLKLEVIKKIIAIPVIIIGIIFGIKTMLIGLIINSFIAYYLNSLYSGNSIDYPAKEQIIDLIPTFGIAMLMGLVLFTLNLIINLEPIIKLGLLTACGLVIVLSLSEIFKLNGYLEIKEVVVKKIKNYN